MLTAMRSPKRLLEAIVLVLVIAVSAFIVHAMTTSSEPHTVTTAKEAATSPSQADAAAPTHAECLSFALFYNVTVGPVVTGTGTSATGNVYLTEITDVFTRLAGTLTETDPYSQTLHTDALGVAVNPSSYTAMVAFTTDMNDFVKQCGMSVS